jgi:ribonucleotide monophosphatase NagD (HAD superfamily)
MHIALRTLGAHSEDSAIVRDRIDTDIVAGIESGLRTILVLTRVTSSEQVERFLALGHVERQLGRLDQALKAYIRHTACTNRCNRYRDWAM